MTENRNFSRLLDLRNKFIAPSWDDKIDHIIKLCTKENVKSSKFDFQVPIVILKLYMFWQ